MGINYFGLCGQLNGCVNDARNMASYLIDYFGYGERDVVILTDDQYNFKSMPTKKNILLAMHWLVNGAHADDKLFFLYSGMFSQPPKNNALGSGLNSISRSWWANLLPRWER